MGHITTSVCSFDDLGPFLNIVSICNYSYCPLRSVSFLLLLAPNFHTDQVFRSWAMYGWAPLAIMGEEINKLLPTASTPATHSRSTEDSAVEMSLMADDPLSTPEELSSSTVKTQRQSEQSDLDADDGMAGIYLGIHNIFATIPQFLATFVSMIVFSILEPGQSPELAAGGPSSPAADGPEQTLGKLATSGLSGTAVCLAIGAVFQLVAAAQSLRMRRY